MITELSLQQVDTAIKKMATDATFSRYINNELVIQQFRVSRLLMKSSNGTDAQESITSEKNQIATALEQLAKIAGVNNFLEYIGAVLPEHTYINKKVRVIRTGEAGFVRSIYQGKLQVFGIPGAPNPSEFDETQVEIIAS